MKHASSFTENTKCQDIFLVMEAKQINTGEIWKVEQWGDVRTFILVLLHHQKVNKNMYNMTVGLLDIG